MLAEQGGELGGGALAERAVRAYFVVIASPSRDCRLHVLQRGEPVFVEAFVAELAVEALDAGVLGGLAWLDQQQLHAVGDGPLVEGSSGELRPLIGPDHGRIAAEAAHHFQDVGHALPVDAAGDRDLHGLLGAVVDHSQALDRPAVGQGVEHEVHRPGVVRTGRDLQRAAFDRGALALSPFAHGQAGFAIQPMDPFVVDHEALALDQDVQSPVAEPPALAGQFEQALLQPVILPLGPVVQHAARQA